MNNRLVYFYFLDELEKQGHLEKKAFLANTVMGAGYAGGKLAKSLKPAFNPLTRAKDLTAAQKAARFAAGGNKNIFSKGMYKGRDLTRGLENASTSTLGYGVKNQGKLDFAGEFGSNIADLVF